ncbi:aspartate/glutamate racemase family protein [Candidatus Bathyarchaeota archaeon]|nr:aspartate/glutamate racemase family protein [Candidatus Bathyarchaeota archaeon]
MSRVGLLLPSSNTVMEPDLYAMTPRGVSVHTARMMLHDVTPEGLEEMAGEAEKAARLLATARVDVMVYGCTSGSLLKGAGWERGLVDAIQGATGTQTVTTAGAVMEALKTLEAGSVSVFTPYTDRINRLEKLFLEGHGFKVDTIKGLGFTDNQRIGRTGRDEILGLVDPDPGSDAVFISCTNLRAAPLIRLLEETHERPVVTSNQASMWAALRVLGLPGREGYGTLLESLAP